MSFTDFWTGENNPKVPKSEYLFGTRHIILIALTVLTAIILSIIFAKKSRKAKLILLRSLASVLLTFEIVSRIVNLVNADALSFERVLKILLPMHICSVVVWVAIIAIFSLNKPMVNFASIAGILATTGFLLYPAVGINRVYMSFDCLYSTLSHAIGFVSAILLISLGFAKFDFKKIWQMFLCFAIMFTWGVLLDFVIFPGSDYMYIVNDPLELGLPFPYQILYGFVLCLYIVSFYLVSFIVNKAKNKKQNFVSESMIIDKTKEKQSHDELEDLEDKNAF